MLASELLMSQTLLKSLTLKAFLGLRTMKSADGLDAQAIPMDGTDQTAADMQTCRPKNGAEAAVL
jgi:hypothetical protein